ncbi:response regulator transcription factor [Clostridium sp. AL.422]|uniref:response regulator transcription factor n=1 Tax=Clostridium TaxID=1485 RepID=UPI00293DEAFD|nr:MULTISPECIES: response regulator transcription factor [unclassified Clostridium]MDV4151742.1 response regulator transcription factor [Clostridium sp. AL.422]
MKILVVEDDIAIRDLIAINLELSGYEVITAEDGEAGKEKFNSNEIDLVLLDVMLPKIDGFELINIMKTKDVPVIFITAKDSVLDRVKGLRLGADDYLVKPFESIELLARIEAVARRYNKNENIIKFNDIEIDIDKRSIKLNEKQVDTTLKEFELLHLFLKNCNSALSREQILDKVWGYDYYGGTRTVDIHVQRLREKLNLKDNIKTVYKVGYRFEK